MVLVLCNLKARKLAGFPSHGMVLCASNEDHSVVKLVSVPVEAKIGEKLLVNPPPRLAPVIPSLADTRVAIETLPKGKNPLGCTAFFNSFM